jgi:endonuclease YncB( thermonuclease family)
LLGAFRLFPLALRFPKDRIYRKRRRPVLLPTVLLIVGIVAAYFYANWSDARVSIAASGQKIFVVDGDSFAIGSQKMRLDGIDAPEYRQSCRDEAGREWQCGRAARAALEKIVLEPGFACEMEARDRYARALATCNTAHTPDVAAAQVEGGMAVTHEFGGMRDYGAEEDRARKSRLGIWRGEFDRPEMWRAANKRHYDTQ